MSRPTVVLLHGAFSDASSFGILIRALLADRIRVSALAVPSRSLNGDADYVGAWLAGIDGPVVLVGHSYGCAVATVAGSVANVHALVYLAGFVPDVGETLGELQVRFPDSDLASALRATPVPGGVDLSVDVERFAAVLAQDIDPILAGALAVSQRPIAAAVFGEPAAAAAWHATPSWGLVAAADRAINPDLQRFCYERAGASTVEVDSSHLVMLSQPAVALDLINRAVLAVQGSSTAHPYRR